MIQTTENSNTQIQGCWQINPATKTIDHHHHDDVNFLYRIKFDGETIDSAQVLDWIVQVNLKRVLNPTCTYHLVSALVELFGNLQKELCPFGHSLSVGTQNVWAGFEKRLMAGKHPDHKQCERNDLDREQEITERFFEHLLRYK
jgi:hypothetical protein